MSVVVEVPIAGDLTVGIGQTVEESVGRVQSDHRSALTLPPIVPHLVDRDLPEPGPERPFPTAVKSGDLTGHDGENLLGQVGRLVMKARDELEPLLDERPIDALQPSPVGVVGRRGPEPIEQADGGWVHRQPPGRILESWRTSYLNMETIDNRKNDFEISRTTRRRIVRDRSVRTGSSTGGGSRIAQRLRVAALVKSNQVNQGAMAGSNQILARVIEVEDQRSMSRPDRNYSSRPH